MRGLMSAAEAERKLGLPTSSRGRALLRRALEKERKTGRKFLVREGGKGKTRYRFTAEMIRRYMPELWEGRFERISRELRDKMGRIHDDITAHMRDVANGCIDEHPKVQQAIDQSTEALEHVSCLTDEVGRLVKTPRNATESPTNGK